MKTILLATSVLFASIVFGQNIGDNNVSFQYTQLPLIKVKEAFRTYETRVEHGYLASNQDSLTAFEMKKEIAKQQYEAEYITYKSNRDNILVNHYRALSTWEQNVNAGKLTADGKPLPKPIQPNLPAPPSYLDIEQPRLNSELLEDAVKSELTIDGFKQGLGGSILTIDVQAIRNIKITEKKSGSGSNTKYKYQCEYVLPVLVKFATPTDGVLLQEVILQGKQIYKMKDQKSRYDHLAYMLKNEQAFFLQLEASARSTAIKATKKYINNQIGYAKKTRKTEIYSVKKFKNYDYSDVTKAYSSTVSALQIVNKDLDHSLAKVKLEAALAQWKEVMFESNDYDKKARINTKVSALIWCNIAEIQFWLNDFEESQTSLSLAENAGVLKAKNHARGTNNFYLDSKKRWDVHY